MLELHALFVLLLIGTQAFFTAIAAKNVTYADRTVRDRSAWLAETLGVDEHEELLEYHRLKTAFGQLQSWIGLAILLLVLYSGLFTTAVEYLAGTGFGPVVQGTAFFVGATVAAGLLAVPFSIVRTFGIEEVFGFNNQTPRLFVRDTIVNTVVSIGLVAILGAAVLWFIEAAPTWWWVAGWALFVTFSLVMQIVYPRVIAPIFNDFDPVAEGDLRDAVEDVFDRAGFSCEQIYTMDASRRSSHLNAYFTGFGRTKRVVLFDTLVDRMALPEIQSVLAHELAHWKRAHIWKQIASGAVQMAIVFAVLGVLVSAEPLYGMFGLPSEATYAGLLVGILIVNPILNLTAPLTNRLSLRHEREADAFAVDVMNDGRPMIDALAALARENLANPFPHPLYATFHYSHPPIPERIRLIEERSDVESADRPDDGGGAADQGSSPA
ncbi:MAG: M48 family metallopeptidase [Halobacteriota archaeon]